MLFYIKWFISTAACFLILDSLWLGIIATDLYGNAYGSMLRLADGRIIPVYWAAAIVYTLLIWGILAFVVPKASGLWVMGLLWGSVFGLVTYGVYDFTNYSVMANWPLKICIIDTLWGCILCGVTGGWATWLAQWLKN